MHFRSRLKSTIERGLVSSGLTRLARSSHRSEVLVLAYHNIVPSGKLTFGDRALHLPQCTFAAQLDLLLETHDVVPLETVLEPPPNRVKRPRVVITFDDAYQGAVAAGVQELAKRGLPATVFVAPAFVGGRSYWWDALADPATGLSADLRHRALAELGGKDGVIRRWATDAGHRAHQVPAHATAAIEEQLRSALSYPGITVGSHTWTHPDLTALDPTDVELEVARPLAWLRKRFESVVPWLTYPYGLSSPPVERAVAAAGYVAALRIEGGWFGSHMPNRFALPRLNIDSAVSIDGFVIRAAGLLVR